ncbi:MFS transporter [Bifidobacterium tibiigranuli]|jgi:MFS family permease|uniref:MFS transporter n=2 Tax=Bifidobacterium tibiigranuli TaxID=2172043 RepID=UPI0026EDA68B|nr:MFS transporter [Bifidobacterium tibiigranuli]MCI2203141.1 MFS transporter [Bifidobacterium tibiigranuli]
MTLKERFHSSRSAQGQNLLYAFFFSRGVSLLAEYMAPLVIAYCFQFSLGGNAKQLSIVVAARTIGMAVTLPIAGFVIGRIAVCWIFLISGFCAAASQITAALFIASGSITTSMFAIVQAVNGVSAAFTLPLFTSLLPLIAPAEKLRRANSWIAILRSGAMVAGPVVAGLVVTERNPAMGLYVSAAMYAATALCGIPMNMTVSQTEKSARVSLASSLGTLMSFTWVWGIVLSFAVVNAAFAGFQSVAGLKIALSTSIGKTGWSTALSAMAIGMVVGGLLLSKVSFKRPLVVGLICSLLMACPMIALMLHPSAVLLFIAFIPCGFGTEVFTIVWQTALQTSVPGRFLPAASSLDTFGSLVAVPIGVIITGSAYDASGAKTLIYLIAIVVLFTLAPLLLPSVRTMHDSETKTESAMK